MENYEEKYKQALENIFPELRESDDEEIMKDIIYVLKIGVETKNSAICPGSNHTVKDAISWIEKQKECEWSEEDEIHRKNCLSVINMILDEKPYPYYNDYLWLKSIKPNHWKPSEYDISLLEEIARNIRNNVRPFCSEVSSLEDLIKNLKKL